MLSGSAMRENLQTGLSRGRRSRNKVSVGEPAEGSFQQQTTQKLSYTEFSLLQELMGALRYSGAVFNVALSAVFTASPLLLFFFFPFQTNLWIWIPTWRVQNASNKIHLSTMDLLVLATMKNAAKCENVVWIAEFNESSTLWTHIAPKEPCCFGMLGWVSVIYHNTQCAKASWVNNGSWKKLFLHLLK